MERRAVLLDLQDNVATCTGEVRKGDTVVAVGDEKVETVAVEDIPIWHKIALKPIKKGEAVIKYGEMIGEADRDIAQGGWVSHENIHSVPRDYASEYILKGDA